MKAIMNAGFLIEKGTTVIRAAAVVKSLRVKYEPGKNVVNALNARSGEERWRKRD